MFNSTYISSLVTTEVMEATLFSTQSCADGQVRKGVPQLPCLRYLRLQGLNYLYEYIMLRHFGTTTAQTRQRKCAHVDGMLGH